MGTEQPKSQTNHDWWLEYSWIQCRKCGCVYTKETKDTQCPNPNRDKTHKEHMEYARSFRDEDKLREHAARISKLPRVQKPCNCGTDEGQKHRSTCPVYKREQWYRRQRE